MERSAEYGHGLRQHGSRKHVLPKDFDSRTMQKLANVFSKDDWCCSPTFLVCWGFFSVVVLLFDFFIFPEVG